MRHRHDSPYWLTAILLLTIICGFFYFTCLLASNASWPVAIGLFGIALVVLYLAEVKG